MAGCGLLQINLLRFGAVSVLGVVVDLGIGWTLAAWLGLPLPIAAVLSFGVGAGVNYILHELWTFQGGSRRLSLGRGAIYMATLFLTLGARVGAALVVECAIPIAAHYRLATLVAATGVSFLVNYALSRYVVFAIRPRVDWAQNKRRSSND